jgi:hypothetical protein
MLLSEKSIGSLRWNVTVLEKNSPPLIGVTPTPRKRMVDISDAVEAQVFLGSAALTQRGERTRFMSDSALQGFQKIAQYSKRIGPSTIYVNANGMPRQETAITTETFRRVKELTDVRYVAFGSVYGKLESISVHRSNEFRIWDEKTGKPVRCKFHQDLEAAVKDLLREKVHVSGVIQSNSAGIPISVEVQDLMPRETVPSLPTIEQMSGLIKDFTGGRTLKQCGRSSRKFWLMNGLRYMQCSCAESTVYSLPMQYMWLLPWRYDAMLSSAGTKTSARFRTL